MSKIRKFARGKECQVRIPGVCNGDNETVVMAHLNGYGMGNKAPDLFCSATCSACHDVLDNRVYTEFSPTDIKIMFLDGIIRTQQMLLDAGLIKIEGRK